VKVETSNLVGKLTIVCPNLPMTIVPERGVIRVTWPILGLYTPLNISGTAEARIVKFCVAAGYIKF